MMMIARDPQCGEVSYLQKCLQGGFHGHHHQQQEEAGVVEVGVVDLPLVGEVVVVVGSRLPPCP